jgi:hypothetical protein
VKSFGVPHLHLITRESYEVWTYADNERGALRRRASAFYEEGIKPIILTCHTDAPCRIYREGKLTPEYIAKNLRRIRHDETDIPNKQPTIRARR